MQIFFLKKLPAHKHAGHGTASSGPMHGMPQSVISRLQQTNTMYDICNRSRQNNYIYI